MSAEARKARKANFALPTAEEIREMQKLEQERSARKNQVKMDRQHQSSVEMQQAGICGNLLIQLPSVIESNQKLISQSREFLELYFERAVADLKAAEYEDEEPEEESESLGGGDESLAMA